MASAHLEHLAHAHVHGKGCGHVAVVHDGHTDYLHGGHLHAGHDRHWDEHVLVAGGPNPAGCVRGTCAVNHTGCGDETLPHADHVDHLHLGRLHHPHGDHCDDHGALPG